ncbi:hypothetical protein CEQ90_06500 [Lewinellaceae bacterium SD302]|nr:hypothetical protein CEQ90_06500 [Lewinellaceae bacterium SD302]
MTQTNCLIIIGMHRSGTSLFAGWLHRCGVRLGEDLLGANYTNPTGHFEDNDFLRLHKAILLDNGLDYKVQDRKEITISPQREDEIKRLVNKKITKNKNELWGWKEPRTSLFLDSYLKFIPSAKVVIIYRPAEEVVASLISRERKKIKRRLNKIAMLKDLALQKLNETDKVKMYLKVWDEYNSSIIETCEKLTKDQFRLFSMQDIVKSPGDVLSNIESLVGKGNITSTDINQIFRKINKDEYLIEKSRKLKEEFPKLLETEMKLNALRSISSPN